MSLRFYSIRILFPLVVIIIAAIGIGASYNYSTYISHRTAIQELTTKIASRMNFLQGSIEELIQLGAPEYTQQTISSISSEADLVLVFASDASGKIIASSKYTQINRPWHSVLDKSLEPQIREVIAFKRPLIQVTNDSNIIGLTPICDKSQTNKTSRCGFIYYEASTKTFANATQHIINEYSRFTLLSLIIVGGVLTLLSNRIITRPLSIINNKLTRFANGDRNIKIGSSKIEELDNLGISLDFLLHSISTNEEILSNSENKMRTIINTVAGAIITINHKGVVENFNPGAQELFGYTSDEVVGKNVNMLMPDPDHTNHDGYLTNYLSSGERKIIGIGRETQAKKKDGSIFPIHLTVSETKIQDDIFFTGIIIDLTQQKKITEALSNANRELFTTNLKLKDSVRIDGMTGLYNRDFFNTNIESELNRATRYKSPLSIIMCDIDYFKKYNDFYGHQQGDTCLIEVAGMIKSHFSRSGEIAARYGGEEFIIIIPNMDSDEVIERARHLCESITNLKMEHQKSDISDYVSLSIGVSSYTPMTEKQPPLAKDLVKTADAALYESKGNGRNQVTYLPFSNK